MAWADVHHAPRDRKVWLFLPCGKWEADPHGSPTKIEHLAVVGRWDKAQSAWVNVKTGHPVYPSLWHDAPTEGVMPNNPQLIADACR